VYLVKICFSRIHLYVILLSDLPLKPYVKYSLDISGLKFLVYFYSRLSYPPLYIITGGVPPDIRTGLFKVTSLTHNNYIIVFGLYTSLPVLIIFKCFLTKVSYTNARPLCEYFFSTSLETEFLQQSLNFFFI